jgi:hypothetical protein
VPQPLDLVVDRGVLLDVGVGGGDVGLGLVVVVVADEVLDGVVGEELPELVGQLGGEGLVGAMTRVGFWTSLMMLAIVKVLPDPVTPSRQTSRSPRPMASATPRMARGWSPAGW